MRAILICVILVMTALVSAAMAAEQAVNPCRADAEKFCKDTPIGGAQRLGCLEEHKSQLSTECLAHLNKREMRSAMRRPQANPKGSWVNACSDDVKKLCQDLPAGRGHLSKCLEQHQAALSPNCKTALDTRKTVH